MPGRMGGKQRTVKNVWVYKIDPPFEELDVGERPGMIFYYFLLFPFPRNERPENCPPANCPSELVWREL